jgi:hypothetical protein
VIELRSVGGGDFEEMSKREKIPSIFQIKFLTFHLFTVNFDVLFSSNVFSFIALLFRRNQHSTFEVQKPTLRCTSSIILSRAERYRDDYISSAWFLSPSFFCRDLMRILFCHHPSRCDTTINNKHKRTNQ